MNTSVDEAMHTRGTRFVDSWRFPALVFVVMAVVLSVVVQTSHNHMRLDGPEAPADPSAHDFIGGWLQFDTGWYIAIAEHGYDKAQVDALNAGQQSAVAYFPGDPIVVRQVARVTNDDFELAAHITTVLAGFAVAMLFWFWCRRRLTSGARTTALLLLLLYPYAWYLYGSGYGDALFIALTIGAFLLVERDRPVLAGLVAAGASATRLIGVGTVIGLVALTIERRQALTREDAAGPRRPWSGWHFDRSRLRARDSGVLLGLGGIVSYCVYLYVRTGDFHAFMTVQSAPGWNQGEGPKTWIKYSFFALVIRGEKWYALRLVIQALFVLLFIIAIPAVIKRIGASYGIYTAVIIAIPLIGSSTFMGSGRYLLGAFPVFALGGQLLEEHSRARPRLRPALLGASAVSLLVLASFFGRGFYLS